MDDEPPSNRNALFALLVVVGLVVAGYRIAQVLRNSSRIEDCLMRGAHNCAPLDPSLRR